MAQQPEVLVGIDVGRDRLESHARRLGRPVVVAHDEAGLGALADRLAASPPGPIGLAASGGAERLAAVGLSARGLSVAVVKPRQTRRLAQTLGPLATTDRTRRGAARALRRSDPAGAARGRRLHLARRAARARPREPARARRARRPLAAPGGGRVAARAPRAMAVLVAIRHNPVIARL